MLLSYEDWQLEVSKHFCWEDRLLHKNSKVRYDANIDLKSLCDSITDPKDHRIIELGYLFKETVSDSDVDDVQDKALDALIAYLKAADADVAGSYAKEICDAIVANCLTDRPETVNKAQIVFKLLVKLEAVDALLPSEMTQLKNVELLKETKRLQKMSLSDSQEQNKKKRQHYGSEKGFRHFVKSLWPDEDFLSDEKVKETLLEELMEEQEWIKSHKCTRCGLFYDMSCVCQQELELDMDEIRPGLFNYGSDRPYLKRAKSEVSDGGGKNHNDDIWSPPWEDPSLLCLVKIIRFVLMAWNASLECYLYNFVHVLCGLFYDMSCVCQQELELDMDEIRPGLFNYGSDRPYLKRAKSEVSDGGGKNHNDDIWSPPWEDPSLLCLVKIIRFAHGLECFS
ncbi:hypothetical protein CTI12_AA625250 [Artemisia annua]|uniref:XMAP215/Dis1/CLASP TOG domain-containing protein n=1 Tax=Artemisia annua TaxID=35608 RepID=A0A2U1KAJ4_ARTAN|nr:hypothetical protein CTI12_AA625250 [Artemisia annua]